MAIERGSGKHRRHGHPAVFSPDDDYAGISHVPSACAVGIEIVSDRGVLRNTNVLIQDGAAQLGAPPDVAVVQEDAAFYQSAGVDVDASSENGLPHYAPGNNASAGYDAVDRKTAAVIFIEDELRGRIGVACAAHWPLAIVEIEFGLDLVQVHISFVEGIDRADIAPVEDGHFRLAGNSVGLEVVSIDGGVAGEFRQDVLAEIVMTARGICVALEQIQKTARGKDVVAHGGVYAPGIGGQPGLAEDVKRVDVVLGVREAAQYVAHQVGR